MEACKAGCHFARQCPAVTAPSGVCGRIAEPDLDRDRITEQRLVECDRAIDIRLDGRRV